MGFFSDLKEDLSQAVNELVPEDGAEAVDAESAAAPETTDDLGKMLDDMDLDGMLADMPAADEEEKNVHSAPVTEHAVESPKGSVSDETGIITSGMTIHGDISSQGSMDVIGSVVGNVDILGKLKVTGAIDGDSHAAEIYAEKAHINGEVKSEGSVKIGPDTIIIGNIFATSAVIAGAGKGDIDVKGPVILDTSAIVMGNIKSKSVQINNGAVIEGLCSQCYADVSPTSFFDDIKKARK